MPLWQRILFTICVMLAAGFIAGLLWSALFDIELPSYIGGLIGGLVTLPTWEFLKRVKPTE